MNTLEDDIRTVLDNQANAMQVPEPRLGHSLTLPRVTVQPRRQHRWMLAAAAAVLLVIVVAVVLVRREPALVRTSTPPDTTATVERSFATAIESAGVFIQPSAEEIALATDAALYRLDSGSTQVSAADNFVSLGTCPIPPDSVPTPPCSTGWAYMTGSVDGRVVHRGLLQGAVKPEVFVLDDRFFVAMETSPGLRPVEECPTCSRPSDTHPPTLWLIDSVSGGRAELTWRDEPTTVSSGDQALLVSDGQMSVPQVALKSGANLGFFPELFLPRVIDGRDGTIRPLAVPDNASADVPVIQAGTGRIWIGTTDRSDIGIAYSDDGGATWTHVALPAELPGTADDAATYASHGDQVVSIAADGDHIAVTDSWTLTRDPYVYVYVSGDAGLSWSTLPVANLRDNGSHLYVLADQRLLLVRSDDFQAAQLVVSTGSDWTTLEGHRQATIDTGLDHVSVNRAGIVLTFSDVPDRSVGGTPGALPSRYHFSTDLTNWRTIVGIDE